MKYTREQRLDIVRCVYDGELTVEEAAVKYEPNPSSVKGYLRLYRAETGLRCARHGTNKRSPLKKRLLSERKWCGEEISSYRQREYQVILELSGDFPVNLLCEKMGIQRSSFYNWKHTLAHPE